MTKKRDENRLTSKKADSLAKRALERYFEQHPITEDIRARLSASIGRSSDGNGWIYEYLLFPPIPSDIDPDSIKIDDSRLNGGRLVLSIHVKAEPMEVTVREVGRIAE